MSDRFKAHFFDIGQGQASTVADGASEEALIVDCAPRSLPRFAALPYNYKLIIVTHLDYDHAADLARIVEMFQPDKVLINYDTAWRMRDNKDKRLLAVLQTVEAWRRRRPPYPPPVGPANETEAANSVQVGSLDWTILGPQHADVGLAHVEHNRNIASTILTVAMGDRKVLYTGDATAPTLQRVVDHHPAAIKADVVVVPHHGGACHWPSQADEQAFYDSVGADLAIISVGSTNSYRHPRRQTLPLVNQASYVMCTQVTKRCTQPAAHDDGTGISRAACAGDVTVSVDDQTNQMTIDPDRAAHQAVVSSWAEPLCRPGHEAPPTPGTHLHP